MCQALCTLDTVSTTDDHLAQMWSYKLILFSAAFFGTLNFYFYNAVLISHLTVTDEQPQVHISTNLSKNVSVGFGEEIWALVVFALFHLSLLSKVHQSP